MIYPEHSKLLSIGLHENPLQEDAKQAHLMETKYQAMMETLEELIDSLDWDYDLNLTRKMSSSLMLMEILTQEVGSLLPYPLKMLESLEKECSIH